MKLNERQVEKQMRKEEQTKIDNVIETKTKKISSRETDSRAGK